MRITVAGVGYVGLSLAVLLAQHHEVTAITTTLAKAEKLNNFISPIQDDEIERFFNEAREGKRKLNLTTMVDKDAERTFNNVTLHIIQEFKGGDNCETAKANNIDNSWICFHHCRLPLFPSSRHRDIYHHRLPGHIYCCGFLSGISSE